MFSIVHAEDTSLIDDVHRELRAGVRLARSTGLRMVAHDGRVWRVDSEWAAFTNPWTSHVEMVVAKHRVVEAVTQVATAVVLTDVQCREQDALSRAILEGVSRLTTLTRAD